MPSIYDCLKVMGVTLLMLPMQPCRAQTGAQQEISGSDNIGIQGAVNTQISIKIEQSGLTAEVIQRIVRGAAVKEHQLSAADQQRLDGLSQELGVTKDAGAGFFRILGQEQVAPENLVNKLIQVANEHVALLKTLHLIHGDDPEAARLRDHAKQAIEGGDYELAKGLLKDARQATRAAAETLLQAADVQRLETAAISAELGRVAMTQLRYLEAAGYFAEGYHAAPPHYAERRRDYLYREADALFHQGNEKGDNDALSQAIVLHRDLLSQTRREREPLDWAATKNNLGNTLEKLGERESGRTRLKQAIAAFSAVLQEVTQEHIPLDWATTKNNLGNALRVLGERENDTTQLEEAVAAFRAALQVVKRENVPLDWARTQNDLGNALRVLGERENGTTRLEEAAQAYLAALLEYTRERVPLSWATTQNNLGTVLRLLGERGSGTAQLQEAVAVYRAVLAERTRERVPLYWGMTQSNLGAALARLGERETGTARLEEAIATYRAALEEVTRERLPLHGAMAQNNLGIALSILGARESCRARLVEAVTAFHAALTVFESAGATYHIGGTKRNLDQAEAALNERHC